MLEFWDIWDGNGRKSLDPAGIFPVIKNNLKNWDFGEFFGMVSTGNPGKEKKIEFSDGKKSEIRRILSWDNKFKNCRKNRKIC